MRPTRAPNYALRRGVALISVLAVLFAALLVIRAISDGGGDRGATADRASSATSTTPTTSPLRSPPPCAIGDVETELAGPEDWKRSVVDTEHRLPVTYAPHDLVSAAEAGLDGSFLVRSFVIADLAALADAAAANGTPIELLAAYRSTEDQQALFDRRIEEFGFDRAAARTARPGHSEHHLGTAVDFKTSGADDVDQSWADEPTGRFVVDQAHRFGFVLSYPRGERASTCYDFEPWHYRYFGPELALRIHESGLTSREYLWHWQQTGEEPTAGPG